MKPKGLRDKPSMKEPAPFDTQGTWSVVLPCGTRIVGEGKSYLVVRPSGDVQMLLGTEKLMRFAE
jgi:hypothetical protein